MTKKQSRMHCDNKYVLVTTVSRCLSFVTPSPPGLQPLRPALSVSSPPLYEMLMNDYRYTCKKKLTSLLLFLDLRHNRLDLCKIKVLVGIETIVFARRI